MLLRTFELQLASIPVVGVAAALGAYKITFLDWVFALWLVSLILTMFRISYWPCPRCGKPFCKKSEWDRSWIYVGQCVHCGLRRPALGFLD